MMNMSDKHSFKVIVIITLLIALGPMATDMYLPALPSLAKSLDTSSSNVQLTLSIYFFGFAIGQLIYGPLSDRFGRKPVLQVGLIIFVLSSAIASLATSIEALIVARVFQALGGCAGPVLGRAIVRDMFSGEEAGRVLSHVSSAMALAPAIAPIIGGFLTVAYGWQASFLFLMLYGLIALLVLTLNLPETNTNINDAAMKLSSIKANYLTILKHQEWRLNTLICSFVYAGLFAFLLGSSFVLIEFMNVSESGYGFLFTVIVLGYMIGSQLSARFSGRIGLFRLIRYGSSLALISGMVMFILSLFESKNVVTVIAPHFFYMISVGIVMPLTMASALNPFPKMAGSASALLGFIQMFFVAFFGVLIGYLESSTAIVMAGSIALAGTLTFLTTMRLEYVLTHNQDKL